jgi:hypothetical protein
VAVAAAARALGDAIDEALELSALSAIDKTQGVNDARLTAAIARFS